MKHKTEAFQRLNRVIHERGRMAIMSLLASSPDLSFRELKDALKMTDGNLSVHIRTLQQAGYIAVAKSSMNNRPHTTCRLTRTGERAFSSYIAALEDIVKLNR